MVKSYANKVDGFWLGDQAAKLGLRNQFERNRDPLAARRLDDQGKTEAQRRGEQTGDGKIPAKKQTRKTDELTPELKPPPHMRAGVPTSGRWQWLSEQQQAAFANIPDPQKQEGPARNSAPIQNTAQQHPTQTP